MKVVNRNENLFKEEEYFIAFYSSGKNILSVISGQYSNEGIK